MADKDEAQNQVEAVPENNQNPDGQNSEAAADNKQEAKERKRPVKRKVKTLKDKKIEEELVKKLIEYSKNLSDEKISFPECSEEIWAEQNILAILHLKAKQKDAKIKELDSDSYGKKIVSSQNMVVEIGRRKNITIPTKMLEALNSKRDRKFVQGDKFRVVMQEDYIGLVLIEPEASGE